MVCFSERICGSKCNLLLNLTPRHFVESDDLRGMSLMKIFRNANCVFILALEILMSYVLLASVQISNLSSGSSVVDMLNLIECNSISPA